MVHDAVVTQNRGPFFTLKIEIVSGQREYSSRVSLPDLLNKFCESRKDAHVPHVRGSVARGTTGRQVCISKDDGLLRTKYRC